MKGPAEELGWSLIRGREGLSGLPHRRKPARSGFAEGWSIWSQQHNEGPLPDPDFWQHNVAVGYRLPKRRVEVRLSLLNILDRHYRLNPLTLYQELPRERTLAASVKFYF